MPLRGPSQGFSHGKINAPLGRVEGAWIDEEAEDLLLHDLGKWQDRRWSDQADGLVGERLCGRLGTPSLLVVGGGGVLCLTRPHGPRRQALGGPNGQGRASPSRRNVRQRRDVRHSQAVDEMTPEPVSQEVV